MVIIIISILCPDITNVVETILFSAYQPYVYCVLGILLLRLYHTFKGSMFEITPFQKHFFLISFSFLMILSISTIIVRHIFRADDIRFYIYVCGMAIGAPLYFGLIIYGIILFGTKMYKITKLRASSTRNVNGGNVWNEKQKKLLYTATKYITLLLIGVCSTWIICLVWIPFNVLQPDEPEWILVSIALTGLDMVINITCLYLQFPFSVRYYDKYCSCFGKCCLMLLTRHKSQETMKIPTDETEEIPLNSPKGDQLKSRIVGVNDQDCDGVDGDTNTEECKEKVE